MSREGSNQQQGQQQGPGGAGTFEQFTELLAQGNLLPQSMAQRGQSSQGRRCASLLHHLFTKAANLGSSSCKYVQAWGHRLGSDSGVH